MSPEEKARKRAELMAQLAALDADEASTPAPGVEASASPTVGGAFVQGDVHAQVFVGRDWHQVLVSLYGPGHETQAQLVRRYLEKLLNELNAVDLARMDESHDRRRAPLKLGDLYVPLDTTFAIEEGSSLELVLRAPLLHERSAKQADKLLRVPVMATLHHHADLTLIGEAGSGKSTVGYCAAMALASAGLGEDGALESLADGSRSWPHGVLVPWVLVLRRFAAWLGEQEPTEASVWNYWHDKEMNGFEPGQAATLLACLKAVACRQGGWVLLDGLDECGGPEARARVMRALSLFKKSVEGQGWRFMTTVRPNAWPEGPAAERGAYSLAPMNDRQRDAFLDGWYRLQAQQGSISETEAEALADDLIDASRREDIRPLAERPLLLTLMAVIHGNDGGRLPDDRVDLFERAVQLLLQRWNERDKAQYTLSQLLGQVKTHAGDSLKIRDLERKLCELAFTLHKGQQGKDSNQAADIGEAQLCRHLQGLLGQDDALTRRVVQHMEDRCGLLLGRGPQIGADALEERRFAFPHRLFQEYLAAKWLAQRADFAAQCRDLTDADAAFWHEVLAMAGRLATPDAALGAAHALVGRRGPAKAGRMSGQELTRALVAAAQIAERGVRASDAEEGGDAVVADVRQWLQAASRPLHPRDGGMRAVQRVRAANALGQLGDPRFDPERFYLPADANLGFVHVPANPHFKIGTRPADAEKLERHILEDTPADELNDQPCPHGEFWIAKYPVTVAQFRAYCSAANVQPGDGDSLRGPPHHPVVWVDWADAQGYARWLTRQLHSQPLLSHSLPKAWVAALPSELEWEAAARAGCAGAVFPWAAIAQDAWDSERANADFDLGTSSPVGSYPPNPWGLYDMVGNVAELTRSRWNLDNDGSVWGYPYLERDRKREAWSDETSHSMVMRGGSMLDVIRVARCAFREPTGPFRRSFLTGFRLVLVPPPA